MKRMLALLIVGVLVSANAWSQDAQTPGETKRFRSFDVVVDSGESTLGAYQVDVAFTSGNVKIVGIEGGEHSAFQDAPHYDPRAIRNERVIIAAFSTQQDLPKGPTRVARINVQITGDAPVDFAATLTTAASSDGTKIEAKLSVTGQGEER